MAITSKNPATEEVFAEFAELTPPELEAKLVTAEAAYRGWREVPIADRAKPMQKAAEIFRARKEEFAKLAAEEMGKTFASAVAEVEKCAWAAEYFATEAERLLAPEAVATDAAKSYVRFDPLGAVLAVMPWNFPYWQVMRFAAPALMAGNVGLLKHASNVPRSALAFEDAFREAGFPEGVFQTLLVGSARVGTLIEDPRIAAVTLTGSEAAGREVARTAGGAIKKTVLELGGSDPFIIFPDADLARAAESATMARLQNNGQSCIAAKRFIVVKDVLDQWLALYADRFRAQKVGDPFDPATTVGPLATADILEGLDAQVRRSLELGATLVVGGKRANGKGYFYEPTILRDVEKGMPAYDEEIFGPVAAIIEAEDEEDAIRIANDSSFGLGASLWTADTEKAERYAAKIESGAVFVNGMVKSDPRLPFGGIKRSGYGRELAAFGIREFVNIKTVWIGESGSPEQGGGVE